MSRREKNDLLMGTVSFTGLGGYREKMLSQLLEQHIPIRNAQFTDTEIKGEVSPFDYFRTAKIARQNGVRIRSGCRQGLYFTIMHYSRRWGLYVGFLVFVLTLSLWRTRVQDISVSGDVSKAQVYEILEQCDIRTGEPIKGLRLSEAEHRLMLSVENCAWVDVSCEGYRVNVTVHKGVEKPEVEGTSPRNLIATRPARIVSQIVRHGESVVANGSSVNTGDMLVSGLMPDGGEHLLTVRADAEIIGEWQETVEFFVPYTEEKSVANGEEKQFRYLVFEDDVYPLFFGKAFAENSLYSEETRVVRVFGTETPFKIRTATYTAYTSQIITRSPENAVSELQKYQNNYEENFFSDYEIIHCEERYYPQDDGIYLILDYTIQGDITSPVEFETDYSSGSPYPPTEETQPDN